MKPSRHISIFITLSLLLSACDVTIDLGTAPTADVNANSTFAAQTVQAVIAGGSLSTPTAGAPAPAVPSLSSPTLGAGVAIDGTTAEPPGPGCNDSATHTAWTFDGKIYDVKIVNTPLAPGKKFIMAWTIQNTGSCTWDDSYVMNFESGAQMTTAVDFPLLQPGQTLSLGQSATVSIEMTAPIGPGKYTSSWRFLKKNQTGLALLNFGVIINVGNAGTSSSLAKPLNLSYSYDCSGGILRVTLNWSDKASGEDGYRIYRDGALVASLSANSTSYVDIAPTISTYIYTVAAFNNTGEAPQPVTVTPTNCL